MKLTTVFTINEFDEDLLKNIEKFCIESYEKIEIIVLFSKNIKNKVKNKFILEDKYIKRFYFEDKKIYEIRNECIKKCRTDYILFLENYKILDFTVFETIYKKLIEENLDFIMFDFKNELELNGITPFNISDSKERYLEEKIYRGTELYKIIRKKELDFACLYTYIYNTKFLKENNIFFSNLDEILMSNFILKSFLCSQNASYIPVKFIYVQDYNNKDRKIEKIDEKKIIKKIENTLDFLTNIKDKEIIKYISKDVLKLLSDIIYTKKECAYMYIQEFKKYIDCIEKISLNNEIIDIEIESEIFYNVQNLYYKINNNYNSYNKQYADIKYFTDVLDNINKNNDLTDTLLNLYDYLYKNKHLRKYKSCDNILKYIRKFIEHKDIHFDEIIYNIKELLLDIENTINIRLSYYKYFEQKFIDILNQVNEVI